MQLIQKKDISVRYPLIMELTRKQNLIEMHIWTQDEEYEPNFIVFENSKIGVVAKSIPLLTYIEEQDYILINILDKNSLNNKKLRSAYAFTSEQKAKEAYELIKLSVNSYNQCIKKELCTNHSDYECDITM